MARSRLNLILLVLVLLLIPFFLGGACDGLTQQKKANFKELEVYPEFRCPGEDVRAHWTTFPDTPIKIQFEGREVSEAGHGDWVLRASDADSLSDPLEITFKIGTAGGETLKKTVDTIHGYEYIARTGTEYDADNYKYKIDLPDQCWSDDIYVYEINIILPKNFNCTEKTGRKDYWLNWQYDKTFYYSGYLNKDNFYNAVFSNGVQAQGIWLFGITNPNTSCLEWETLANQPAVQYKVACKK